jgi:hypothetical protein
MTDMQQEEAETDRIADAQTTHAESPWDELDRLDLIFVGMILGGGLMFLLFFFRVI